MGASMSLCDLHKIEQHRHQDSILLKVDSHSNIGFVIWWHPGISREVQCPIMVLVCIIIPCLIITDQSTYIQGPCNPLSALSEYILDITRDSLCWRYVQVWSTCLHHALKPVIVNYFERTHAFSNPSNSRHASRVFLSKQVRLWALVLTIFQFWCGAGVSMSLCLLLPSQMRQSWTHLSLRTWKAQHEQNKHLSPSLPLLQFRHPNIFLCVASDYLLTSHQLCSKSA